MRYQKLSWYLSFGGNTLTPTSTMDDSEEVQDITEEDGEGDVDNCAASTADLTIASPSSTLVTVAVDPHTPDVVAPANNNDNMRDVDNCAASTQTQVTKRIRVQTKTHMAK